MSNALKVKVDFGDVSDDRLLPSFDREGMKSVIRYVTEVDFYFQGIRHKALPLRESSFYVCRR